MRTTAWPSALKPPLVALALLPFLAGCPHRAPAPEAAEDWYRKAKLFDAFDTGAADLSLPNAYLLELACYVGDRGTFEVDRTLAAWGFDQRKDFRDPRTSTYGYVASNDRMVLVTFGGTDFLNARDLLSDADALELVYDERYCATPDARVHRGFRDSLNSVIDGVVDEVQRQARDRPATRTGVRRATTSPVTTGPAATTGPATTRPAAARAATRRAAGMVPPNKKLFIAGHSRGGAFANLAAVAMNRLGTGGMDTMPPIGAVYTFGQPRVGNGPFAESLAAGPLNVPLYRLINRDDPVANVPPAGLIPQRLTAARGNADRHGYQHAGVAAHFQSDGRVVRQTTEPTGLPDPRTATTGLSNHYQPAYQQAIRAALTDPALVTEPNWRAGIMPEKVNLLPVAP